MNIRAEYQLETTGHPITTHSIHRGRERMSHRTEFVMIEMKTMHHNGSSHHHTLHTLREREKYYIELSS